MQDRHMEQLMKQAFTDHNPPAGFADKIQQETVNLPRGFRTPTEAEIVDMRQYAREYRKQNPRASDREIRRATQRKFHVRILPNTSDYE